MNEATQAGVALLLKEYVLELKESNLEAARIKRELKRTERALLRTHRSAAKRIYKLKQDNRILENEKFRNYYPEATRYKWVLRNARAVEFYQHFRSDPTRIEKFREILKMRKYYSYTHLLFAEYQQSRSYRPSDYNGTYVRRLP